MSFFISDAIAQGTAGASGQPGFFGPQLIMLIAIFVLFYFLLIRPQAKRAKEHKQMVESLSKGDEVVSSGGLLGRIADMDDNFITLEVAEGVKVKVQRQAVTTLVPKGTFKGKVEEK
jgi:preprotein translocase subunit YajC